MNMRQILLMNLGFFGIQYSFGMQQTAVNPIYDLPRGHPDELPHPQPRRADHRPADPAADRRAVRPDVEPAVGSPQAVLPHRRDRVQPLPVPVPVRHRGLDGGAAAVAARRQQQHGHGALPGVHRRQAAAPAAGQGLPRAELLHRLRHHAGQRLAVRLPDADRRGDRRRHPVLGASGRSCSARSARSPRCWCRSSPRRRSRRARRSWRRCAPRRAASARRCTEIWRGDRRDAAASCASWRWSTCSSGTAMVCYWQFVSLSIAKSVFRDDPEDPGVRGRGVVDRPGQRLVQHRHVLRRLPARRLRARRAAPSWCTASCLLLAAGRAD